MVVSSSCKNSKNKNKKQKKKKKRKKEYMTLVTSLCNLSSPLFLSFLPNKTALKKLPNDFLDLVNRDAAMSGENKLARRCQLPLI